MALHVNLCIMATFKQCPNIPPSPAQLCFQVSGHTILNTLISSCTWLLGEGGREKEALWLTLDPSRGAALLHFTGSPTAATGGEKAQKTEEDIFHQRERNSSVQNRKHGLHHPSGNHSHWDAVEWGCKTLEEQEDWGMWRISSGARDERLCDCPCKDHSKEKKCPVPVLFIKN